jgi:hypothetical protein
MVNSEVHKVHGTFLSAFLSQYMQYFFFYNEHGYRTVCISTIYSLYIISYLQFENNTVFSEIILPKEVLYS